MSDEILAQTGILPGHDDETPILLQLQALVLQLSQTIEELTIIWDILAQEEEN